MSEGLERLSLNQASIPAWSLVEAAEGCARAGVGWIGVWRERLADTGEKAGSRALRDAGLRASSLLRGGFFDAPDAAGRRSRMEDNRRAVEEAARLGAEVLVLVCGPAAGGDLPAARARVAEAVAELGEHAAASGVVLGIEPLHPVYSADR